jgi:hypothetical protein
VIKGLSRIGAITLVVERIIRPDGGRGPTARSGNMKNCLFAGYICDYKIPYFIAKKTILYESIHPCTYILLP